MCAVGYGPGDCWEEVGEPGMIPCGSISPVTKPINSSTNRLTDKITLVVREYMVRFDRPLSFARKKSPPVSEIKIQIKMRRISILNSKLAVIWINSGSVLDITRVAESNIFRRRFTCPPAIKGRAALLLLGNPIANATAANSGVT